MTNPTVIVVGAGPVGLATALGLAQAGIDVTVVDRAPAVRAEPRAVAYLFFVHDGFSRLGVLDDLVAEGLRGDGMNLIDFETNEQFHSSLDAIADDVAHPYTLHLGQDQVSRILLRHLQRFESADVRFDAEVTALRDDGDAVVVEVSGPNEPETLRASWVVGADGANSFVRKALGLPFDGITWPDRFVSTNVLADIGSAGVRIANWRIDPAYGAIIAQITAENLWRYTFRESGSLPEESLEERIHAHFVVGMPGGVPYELVQFQPYRMHQRSAQTYRVGRVVLAGDAAHITNPVGGLGLTGGFLDSFVLTESLAAVIHGRVEVGILDAYAHERRKVFLEVASPAATANKRMLFDPHDPDEKESLRRGLRLMASDRERRRQDLLSMRAMVTPSLVREVAS